MRHIFNFIKFGIIITVLEFINRYLIIRFNLIPYKLEEVLAYSLLAILLIFIAFNRKYIVFKKDDWKQNIVSIIFIIFSLLWFLFIYLCAFFLFFFPSLQYTIG